MGQAIEVLDAEATGKKIAALARKAQLIRIVSPFISDAGVRVLTDALTNRKKVTVRLLTSAEPCDVLTGATSRSGLDTLVTLAEHPTGRTWELRRIPEVHAKLYLFDEKCAIVGSSNLSRRGLGGGNLEACGLTTHRATVQEIGTAFFEAWWQQALPLDRHYLALVDETIAPFKGVAARLNRLRGVSDLCSVRVPKCRTFFDSVVHLLAQADQDKLSLKRLTSLLQKGHAGGGETGEGKFNPEKRVYLLKALGLLTHQDGRMRPGPGAAAVRSPKGRTWLWERLVTEYPDLGRLLACLRQHGHLDYEALPEAMEVPPDQKYRYSPHLNWLVALEHAVLEKHGSRHIFRLKT